MSTVRLRALVPVVLAMVLAACTTSQTFHHQISPFVLSTTAKPPPTVDLSATPVGWVPVAYGDAQVSVPASFHVYYPGWLDCEPIGNALTLGPPTPLAIGCPSHQGPTLVNLSHIDGVPSAYRSEKPLNLNGVALYLSPSYGPEPVLVYYVPSISIEVTADGPLARRIVDTLTRSPRVVALASGSAPSVPSSWRSVTFAGLRFSVPADWPITRTTGAAFGLGTPCATPGVAFPNNAASLLTYGVTLDTDLPLLAVPACPTETPLNQPPMNGVQVDSGSHVQFGVSLAFSTHCLTLHGLTACPATSPAYSILVLKVTVPGRVKPVFVSIGLAGNGMVARTILYSLRAASSSDACPGGLDAGFFAPGELYGVQFLSVTTGWTVGSNEILATDDGGLRWTVQYRARCADLSEIDFVDAEHGWAVGATDLLVTTDGGRRWQQLHEPAWPVRSVHFVTSRVGYAVAGGGTFDSLSPMAPWTGGVVLKTDDAGQSWTLLDAPADAQSVCFSTADDGWLGADGRVYRSFDGGRSWALALKGYGLGDDRPLATVQCAGQKAGWAELDGPGGEMSQTPHVAYHSEGGVWTPIFAERYFPYPGVAVSVDSPGAEPGAFSAIDADTAAFIDGCLACGFGAAPWAIATRGGKELLRRGDVGYITVSLGASFVTSRSGWVTGMYIRYGSGGTSSTVYRLVHTSDGGRTWKVEYTS